MKTYKVKITEHYTREVKIKANSAEAAEELVQDLWDADAYDYSIRPEDFDYAEFDVEDK